MFDEINEKLGIERVNNSNDEELILSWSSWENGREMKMRRENKIIYMNEYKNEWPANLGDTLWYSYILHYIN